MSEKQYTIHDPVGQPLTVTVRRDKRLKKSARWQYEEDGSILLRIPDRLRQSDIARLLGDVEQQLERQETQRRQRSERNTDADLQARAEHINHRHFGEAISWEAIRWVGNMSTRLGSCTNGGPTDGHIRISDKIRDWPQWVIDYVIAHEMAHRIYPNHGREFWDYLEAAYPLSERARGFIKGYSFAQGIDFGDDED
jgi:predicted metal-dependent hydrolase